MMINRSIALGNLLLAISFLIYLCILDFLFVYVMDEQSSFINDLGLLIVLMPFVGAIWTYRMISNKTSIKMKIFITILLFWILVFVGFIEYLWVATHFHIFLGGKI